jgi:hypothetical protein
MARISEFLTEAAYLWILTAIVVVVASLVHYAISCSDRRDLKRRVTKQEVLQEPEDFQESSPGTA